MSSAQSSFKLSVLLVMLALPSFGWARPQLDDRVRRLENIVENESKFDLVNQLAALQQEIQELRGKVEEQQNEIQVLSKKQDKLFTNLDSRLTDATKTKVASNQKAEVEVEEEDQIPNKDLNQNPNQDPNQDQQEIDHEQEQEIEQEVEQEDEQSLNTKLKPHKPELGLFNPTTKTTAKK